MLLNWIISHPFYSLLTLLCFVAGVRYIIGVISAIRSPLSKIPGPWYAPFTTLHLSYGFAKGDIWKTVEKAHQEYGPILRLGPRQIWVSDRDAMAVILKTTDLPKVAMYAEISRDRFSPGLFGEIRHDPHKRLKRFLSPAFTVGYIDRLESIFAQCIEELIHKYDDLCNLQEINGEKGPATTDLMVDIHNLALDIMGECSFGRGFGLINPNKPTGGGLEERIWKSIPSSIFTGMTRRYQTVYFKRMLRRLGLDLHFDWPAEMIKAIDFVTSERITKPGASRPDLLQHLVEEGENPANGFRMSSRDIIDQSAEILLAGSETTSGTIACFLLEVLRNPEVKIKLLDSLPPVQSDRPMISSKTIRTDPTYSYLEACIKETLRLHPIASEMGRRTGDEPFNLLGYELPPHTVVSASYRDLHRNPEHWPQPLRFWPERWLDDQWAKDTQPVDMQAYYPFSAGKHSCIGKNFAWAEMRMVICNLLSRFDFVEVTEQDIDYRQYITMQFKQGTWKVAVNTRQR